MVGRDAFRRRWTRAEYDRLIDLGVLQPEDPIELLVGPAPEATSRYLLTAHAIDDLPLWW